MIAHRGMNSNCVVEDFGGTGVPMHFAHANGYPPGAYRRLLHGLSEHYSVKAMHMRPLWPDSNPDEFTDWRFMAGDLNDCLAQQIPTCQIGAGHSMGANATLRLALHQPERFSALILIDPVIFPPAMSYIWEAIYRLGLAYRLHPLVRSALKRRNRFANREAMLVNYRSKPVFHRISDENLADYVDALACPDQNGSLTLRYPPRWEARIYVTAIRADLEIWKKLPDLKPPTLVIRGEQTDTFWPFTAFLFKQRQAGIEIATIPDCTHLVPLENPQEVQKTILDFLGTARQMRSD